MKEALDLAWGSYHGTEGMDDSGMMQPSWRAQQSEK
jgi:hypothetical protein